MKVALFGVLIGSVVATSGFLVMQNPMRLTRLSPLSEGYYQRLCLDRLQRIWLRLLGVLVSLFGLVILTAALRSLLKQPRLDSVSGSLFLLMGVLFVGMWAVGIPIAIVQLIRGRTVDVLGLWRRSIQLGPIEVYPPITPSMEREAKCFTFGFCLVVGLTGAASLYFW